LLVEINSDWTRTFFSQSAVESLSYAEKNPNEVLLYSSLLPAQLFLPLRCWATLSLASFNVEILLEEEAAAKSNEDA